MRVLIVVLVLIASWEAPRLEATIVVEAELPDLVAQARTIVHGRVISTEPRVFFLLSHASSIRAISYRGPQHLLPGGMMNST